MDICQCLLLCKMVAVENKIMASTEQTDDSSLERYIGNTIRQLRQKHRLTIAEVCDRANISRGMLSKIENAQTATSLETLAKLASALGV